MGYWGKIIGGVAGFAVGGPLGAMVGATLGHAADSGTAPRGRRVLGGGAGFNPAQIAAMFGRREQAFAIAVVVLSAKLAKCDAPVNRAEIDAFKRQYRIPPSQIRDVARLFDEARDSTDGFENYATQLSQLYADQPTTLAEILAALFGIAAADGPVNRAELLFLSRVHGAFGLDQAAWDEARGAAPRRPPIADGPDSYAVLGLIRGASNEEVRAAWKRLVRKNHPDSLASATVLPDTLARATTRVAEINAAWDSIKRERHL
jgi:DnaJ like chaperone protein